MSFKEQRLEDLCELVIDCPHSTPKWTDKGFIVLRNQNIRNGVLDLSAPSFTDEDGYKSRIKRAKPRVNDIVFTREAPMGEVCLIPEGIECCLGQRQVLLRANGEIDPYYLFWALQSPYVQHQISWNEGTGTTVSNVRIPVLKDLKIPRLGGHESWIAKTMTSLALKSQINEKINQTLEQMAQALFKSWFVDFEPVKAKMAAMEEGGSQEDATLAALTAISGKNADALAVFEREHPEQYAELKATAELFPSVMQDSELGEIPGGWMVNPASAHYNISIGKTPPRKEAQWFSTTDGDLKWVSIKDMGNASTYISETSERLTHEAVKKFNIKVMPADTVFLSFKLTVGRVCITTEDMCSNEAIAHFIPKENKYKSHWLYHALHSFDFNKLGSTSSIATAVNSKTIRDMKLIFPNELIAQKYTEKVSSLMQLQKLNAGQTNNLTLLRDTLLPKLLSGEITLPEAEQAVSEAENV